MFATRLIAAVAALTLLGASASTARQSADAPPGEGVMCALALMSFAAEAGRRCTPRLPADLQAELDASVTRLDAYVLANGMTTAELAEFKTEQAGIGRPLDQLCPAADGMVEALSGAGVEELRSTVDQLVARPGRPTWGACV